MKGSVGGIFFRRGMFSQSFSHGRIFYLLPEMSFYLYSLSCIFFIIEAQLRSAPSLSHKGFHQTPHRAVPQWPVHPSPCLVRGLRRAET